MMSNITIEQVRSVISKEFPNLWEPVEVALSTIAAGLLKDLPHCIGLIYQDQPSSSKTTVLDILGHEAPIHIEPNFTPASFVSQYAGRTKQDLDKIDLLPRIQHKILVTKEMAGFFGQRYEDLIANIAALTEIFDGRGYQRSSGVHGQRGYQGDYRFCMLGATTPLEHRVWQVLGKLGSRWVFYRMPKEEVTAQTLANEMAGGYRDKIEKCRNEVTEFIRWLWQEHGEFAGFSWNLMQDNRRLQRILGAMAMKVSQWRGLPLKQDGIGYNPALEEVPRRLAQTLYALARGHALLYGRTQLEYGDIEFVSHIAYASMPEDRARIFQYLWEREGDPESVKDPLTIQRTTKLLGCTYPTAARVIAELIVLGVVEKHDKYVGFPIPTLDEAKTLDFLP
jgi:hypothetical protein